MDRRNFLQSASLVAAASTGAGAGAALAAADRTMLAQAAGTEAAGAAKPARHMAGR